MTVSWTPNSFGDRNVDSYQIKRYDLGGTAQKPHGDCEKNVAKDLHGHGCPTGSWRYTVVPVKGGWTGPESEKSDAVIVADDGKAVVFPTRRSTRRPGPPPVPPWCRSATRPPGRPAATRRAQQPAAWTLQPGPTACSATTTR